MEVSKNPAFDQVCGSVVTKLINRGDITEIYVNDDGNIWYDSYTDGKVRLEDKLTPEVVRAIIEIVAGQSDKVANAEIPSVSTEIRGYGCRFQGELPPIVRRPQFNIRKKAEKVFTFEEYVETGMLSEEYKEYLEKAIVERKNILVIGGTGTGKTTFLNAILEAISRLTPHHRIISLEDLPELQCPALDYSPMFTMQDVEDKKHIYNMTKLLADCMRRSPDRIVVGEVRDGAAYTMLKAWNTGHPGGACTVHANSAEQGLTRIKSLAQEDSNAAGDLKELIGDAIDVAVSLIYIPLPDGRKTRRVNDIIEVKGYDAKEDKYLLNHV